MALNYTFIELPQGGRLALSERPKIKEITSLRADCTHMVTLLAAKGEQAQRLGDAAHAVDIHWDWVKITKITALTPQEMHDFKHHIKVTLARLTQGASVLVHCSAGLHRTGIFAYVLLQHLHISHDDTLTLIHNMKPETARALQEEKYITIAQHLL